MLEHVPESDLEQQTGHKTCIYRCDRNGIEMVQQKFERQGKNSQAQQKFFLLCIIPLDY